MQHQLSICSLRLYSAVQYRIVGNADTAGLRAAIAVAACGRKGRRRKREMMATCTRFSQSFVLFVGLLLISSSFSSFCLFLYRRLSVDSMQQKKKKWRMAYSTLLYYSSYLLAAEPLLSLPPLSLRLAALCLFYRSHFLYFISCRLYSFAVTAAAMEAKTNRSTPTFSSFYKGAQVAAASFCCSCPFVRPSVRPFCWRNSAASNCWRVATAVPSSLPSDVN